MKNFFSRIFWFIISIIFIAGYVNNILWLVDHWSRIEILNKIFHLVSLFVFPPLGAILGIAHFFNIF